MIKTLAIAPHLTSLRMPAGFAREPDRENGALARGGIHFASSSGRARDTSDSGAATTRSLAIRTKEGAEDSRQVFLANAAAIIFDFYDHFPARPILVVAFTQSHNDGPVAVNSFDCVGEQSVYGILDLRRVNVHDDRR